MVRGKPGVHFDDEQPVGIGAGLMELTDRGAGVQGQAQVSVGVGWRRDRRHHPRSKAFEERAETTEVGRHEGHIGALVDQHAPDRTVETTQCRTPGLEKIS